MKNVIKLNCYPISRKYACGILLEKGNKCNKFYIKSYKVKSFLNYMGKLIEKVVVKKLSHFCEGYLKLHNDQIEIYKKSLLLIL